MTRSLFVLPALALLATCSTGTAPATPAPTPTPLTVLASTYVRLVTPSNTAIAALNTALAATGANMTTTRAAFSDYLAALTTLNAELPAFQAVVPAATRPDVQQLRQGVAVELSDVQAILGATDATTWTATVLHWGTDVRSFAGAAQLVRADLGLPPVQIPSSSP